jgi:hypothetical protein
MSLSRRKHPRKLKARRREAFNSQMTMMRRLRLKIKILNSNLQLKKTHLKWWQTRSHLLLNRVKLAFSRQMKK